MPSESLTTSGRLAQPSDRLVPGAATGRRGRGGRRRTLRSEPNHPLLASRVAPPRERVTAATGRKEDARKREQAAREAEK